MTEDPVLSEADLRGIIRLLGEIHRTAGDADVKKRELMDGLCRLIDADSWAWGLAKDADPGEPSVHLSLFHGGFTDETFAMFTQAYAHPQMTEIHAPFVEELRRTGGHLTRLRQQIDPLGRAWQNDAAKYWKAANISGLIMSIYPTGREFLSTIGIYRRVSAPLFTERESRIAHVVLGGVSWLHRDGAPECSALPRLTARQRMVAGLLIQGYSRQRIADHFSISLHTANEYVKRVYELFRVNSQASLVAHFNRSEGGDSINDSKGAP